MREPVMAEPGLKISWYIIGSIYVHAIPFSDRTCETRPAHDVHAFAMNSVRPAERVSAHIRREREKGSSWIEQGEVGLVEEMDSGIRHDGWDCGCRNRLGHRNRRTNIICVELIQLQLAGPTWLRFQSRGICVCAGSPR